MHFREKYISLENKGRMRIFAKSNCKKVLLPFLLLTMSLSLPPPPFLVIKDANLGKKRQSGRMKKMQMSLSAKGEAGGSRQPNRQKSLAASGYWPIWQWLANTRVEKFGKRETDKNQDEKSRLSLSLSLPPPRVSSIDLTDPAHG